MTTHTLIIDRIEVFYDEPLVVIARDEDGRRYAGLAFGHEEAARFAYVQLDHVTERELRTGAMDLLELLTTHGAGLVLEGGTVGAQGERVSAFVVPRLPPEALPAPGFFLPLESPLEALAA